MTRSVRTFYPETIARHLVGADHLLDMLQAFNQPTSNTYPPYNIKTLDENTYQVEMAVAGFKKDEIAVTVQNNELTIAGTKAKSDSNPNYTHNGLGFRNFKHTFTLFDYAEIPSAKIEDGLLIIDIVRNVPESRKPRTISIG